jgi:hypothetical protein|tara:strand:+ start:448 stop:609 length:162 start_codon:yes stop_codon:yes gene_type:complete
MNTGSDTPFFQSRKENVLIEFVEEIVKILVIVSSSKMSIGDYGNLQVKFLPCF